MEDVEKLLEVHDDHPPTNTYSMMPARDHHDIYIDILEETADPTVHLNANRILYYIDTCAPDTPFMDSV